MEVKQKMAMSWYAVHTLAGHEQKAKRYLESAVSNSGLEEKFGQVLVPTEEVTEMRQGKRTTTTKKFLPSYISLKWILTKRLKNWLYLHPESLIS